MAQVVLGSEGLLEADIILPQSTSLTFDVIHKDKDGNVYDHSSSTAHMAFQTKDGKTTYVMDSCCSCAADKIRVTIPASMSEALPLGKLVWDLIVITALGEQVRICYGNVKVVDTYAMDEQE